MGLLVIFCVAVVCLQFPTEGIATKLFKPAVRSAEEGIELSEEDVVSSDDVTNLGDFLNSPQWKELVKLLEKLEKLGNKEAQEEGEEREDINMDEWRQLLADMDSPEFKAKWGITENFDEDDDDDDSLGMYKTPEWREFMIATATKENLADPTFRAKWMMDDQSKEAAQPTENK